MKTLKKLFTMCVVFVFSIISFTACKNSNDNTSSKPSAKHQGAGSFVVEFSSEISIEYNQDSIVSTDTNRLYIEKDAKITPTLKELKTNPNTSLLELGYIPSFVVNGKTVEHQTQITVSENLNISLSKTFVKVVGVAVYQNHPTNPEFNMIENHLDFIKNNLSINKTSISSNNSYIFTAMFDSNLNITSNTRSFISNMSNHLTVGIEVFFETTTTYSVLILQDEYGAFHYQPIGINTLTSNGTNMIFDYTLNLSPNIINPFEKFTLKLSNNFSSIKK